MGKWQFVKSEATVNLASNPSLELNLTGWTGGAGTLTRSTEQQFKGLYSAKYVPSSGSTDGLYYTITLSTNTDYTVSVSVHGADSVPYQVRVRNETAGVDVASVTFIGAGEWSRQELSFTSGATGTEYRIYIEKNDSSSTAAYYVDALQPEEKEYATTYCDGDQDDCLWTAGAHQSTSSRDGQSAAGGRVLDFDDDDYLFEVRSSVGVGTPPVELIDTLPAQSDGADHQRTIIRPRQFQLVGPVSGDTFDDLLLHRLNLINVLNHHRLPTDQPVRIRYEHNSQAVEIAARYEGGLEKGQLQGVTVEPVSLRFKAQENPLWKSVLNGRGQGALSATVQTSLSVSRIIQRQTNGVWSDMDGGPADGSVRMQAIVQGLDGAIYAGNGHTSAGSNAAVHKFADGAWTTIGGPDLSTNTNVYDMAVAPNGDIYICGDMTWDGASYVLKWNGSSWSQVGTPASTTHYCLKFDAAGNLYAGTGTNKLRLWDGSSWSDVVTASSPVLDVEIDKKGWIWIAGGFSTVDGNSITGIAYSDDGGANWYGIATFNTTVYVLRFGPDGRLYLGGAFSIVDSQSIKYIAVFNGTTVTQLGGGIDTAGSVVRAIAFDRNGNAIIGGETFTQAGGVQLVDSVVKWTGSVYVPVGVDLPGGSNVYSLLTLPTGELFIGFDTTGTAVVATVN